MQHLFSSRSGGLVRRKPRRACCRIHPGARGIAAGGGVIGMLRYRGLDRISFDASCRAVMNYQHEYFSATSDNPHVKAWGRPKRSFELRYRSGDYYYQRSP